MIKLLKVLELSPKRFILKQLKCIVLILASSVSSLFFPFFLGKIIDQGVEGLRDLERVSIYLIALIFSGILMATFQYLQNVNIYKLEQEISVKIKEKVYAKCIKGNWNFWNFWKTGDILRILGEDVAQIENTITIILGQLLVNACMILGISIMLFYYNGLIGSASIILCFILVAVQKKIGKQIQNNSFILRSDVEITSSYMNETINNMAQYTMSGLGNRLYEKFKALTIGLSNKAVLQAKRIASSRYIGMMYNVIVVSFALVLGIKQINNALLTMGELYTITIFVQRLYSPIVGVSDAYLSLKKIVPIINRVTNLLISKDTIETGEVLIKEDINKIEFNNVSFSYDGKRNLFTNVDFKISRGQIVGIVGENGTGKSTVIRLLLKMCNCTIGDIKINSVDISKINIEFLHNKIGVMNQEGILLSGTVRDTVNPLKKPITEEKIYKILDNLAFNIKRFPDGLDTVINANSANLSGGERQKLDLARVIIEDKPVIIFDEPTSALDMESEDIVCKYLEKLLLNKIAIVITHRENILKICTMVINL